MVCLSPVADMEIILDSKCFPPVIHFAVPLKFMKDFLIYHRDFVTVYAS